MPCHAELLVKAGRPWIRSIFLCRDLRTLSFGHRESPHKEASALGDSDVVGTVMVRDVVSRAVVAHFRGHTAPLLLLQWDASGTLLVTASVHGHNVNIFQV